PDHSLRPRPISSASSFTSPSPLSFFDMRETVRVRGIVLKTTALRESDLIVTLLTPELGLLRALARGARRSKRRFMGGIDLFGCGDCTLPAPRGESSLHVLESISEREYWPHMRTNLRAFSAASLGVECALLLAPEGDPEGRELFEPLRGLFSTKDPDCDIIV